MIIFREVLSITIFKNIGGILEEYFYQNAIWYGLHPLIVSSIGFYKKSRQFNEGKIDNLHFGDYYCIIIMRDQLKILKKK